MEPPGQKSALLVKKRAIAGAVGSWMEDVKTAARGCERRGDEVSNTAGAGIRSEEGQTREMENERRSHSMGSSTGRGLGLGVGMSVGDTCGGLATAVEKFASCLEASVCRRGSMAEYPPACNDVGVSAGVAYRHVTGGALSAEGSAPTPGPRAWVPSNGGRLTPSEVVLAIREANGIDAKGGGGGCNGRDNGFAVKAESRRLLWGLDEDGESVKEVVAYGEWNGGANSEVRGAALVCL